jgi:hypothetical protein
MMLTPVGIKVASQLLGFPIHRPGSKGVWKRQNPLLLTRTDSRSRYRILPSFHSRQAELRYGWEIHPIFVVYTCLFHIKSGHVVTNCDRDWWTLLPSSSISKLARVPLICFLSQSLLLCVGREVGLGVREENTLKSSRSRAQ